MTPQTPDRLTFRNIISNFFHDLISADRGMWGTIVQLTLRPRQVIDTFLFEDRQRFVRPTRYVLFALSVAALTFVAIQWRYGQPIEEYLRPTFEQRADESVQNLRQSLEESLAALTDEEAIARKRKENEETVKALRDGNVKATANMVKYGNYISIVFLPLAAFVYWLIFPRKGFNYAEHLASFAYISSHGSLLSVLLIPFILFARSPDGLLQALLISSLLAGCYQLYATFRVYVNSWKDVLISTFAFVAFSVGTVLLVRSLSYVTGYMMGRFLNDTCTNCDVNYWKILRPLPALLFFAMMIMVRIKPERWWLWGGVGLVALVGCFL